MTPGLSRSLDAAGPQSGSVLYAFNVSRLSFINLGVTVANTRRARLRGLLFGRKLRMGEGIWIIPSRGVHTILPMAPLDAICLDAQLRVLHVVENMSRFRIAPLWLDCASTLQLPAGSIASSGTRVGDQLLIKSPGELDEYWASQLPPTPP